MVKKHKQVHKIMYEKLLFKPMRLGLAIGIMKSLCLFFLGVIAMVFGWGSALIRMLGSVMLGYEASFLGILLGVFWGFACGFITGYLFAEIYNKLGECNF